MPVHIGEAALEAVVVVDEALVVEAHGVQNGGVEIVNNGAVVRRLKAKLITRTVAHAGFHARADNEADERAGVEFAPEQFFISD